MAKTDEASTTPSSPVPEVSAAQRSTLRVLVSAQVLSGAGLAAALVNTAFQLGVALGLAIFSAIATAHTNALLRAHARTSVALR